MHRTIQPCDVVGTCLSWIVPVAREVRPWTKLDIWNEDEDDVEDCDEDLDVVEDDGEDLDADDDEDEDVKPPWGV